jgi:hypothetical protein
MPESVPAMVCKKAPLLEGWDSESCVQLVYIVRPLLSSSAESKEHVEPCCMVFLLLLCRTIQGQKNICKKTRKIGVGQSSMVALFSILRSVGGPNQGCACRTKNINWIEVFSFRCCGTCACRTVQNRASLEPRAAPPWLTRCSRRAKETATRKGYMSRR